MKRLTLEEFEELVSDEKTQIFEAAEESGSDVTVTVEDCAHAFSNDAITVTDDDIYVPIECSFDQQDISIVAASNDGEALASVLAVLSDALDIELNEESFILPEGMDAGHIFEQAEWCLTNGLG